MTRRWTLDEDAVSIVYAVPGEEQAGILTLAGEFHPLPAGVAERNLAPGLRHFVQWWAVQDEARNDEQGDDGEGPKAWSFDIVEVPGGRTLYTVAAQAGGGSSAGDWRWVSWEWADANTFAWSNGFDFHSFRLGGKAPPPVDEVKVLDITTGEIEILTGSAYATRFATPGASVNCTEDTIRPCSVLIDGEVVGQGRWATIIGSIDLE